MKLLLFDIDGTLLSLRGEGIDMVRRAFRTAADAEVHLSGISFAGRTDTGLVREIAGRNGIDPDDGPVVDRVLAVYAAMVSEWIQPQRVHRLAGVERLLERLARRPDAELALVTGNMEPVAFLKLKAAGFERYFSYGAFGSDHPDRNRLPGLAAERAHHQTGRRFEADQVVVIGDTEHDVACARAFGAVSVAVCTGTRTRDMLAPLRPDVLLDDLSDADHFVDRVFG